MGKHIYVRECYENGNIKNAKIYEVHAICNCEGCNYRRTYLRNQTLNQATVTTRDINKVEEIKEFLSNWKCQNGKQEIKTEYFKFD